MYQSGKSQVNVIAKLINSLHVCSVLCHIIIIILFTTVFQGGSHCHFQFIEQGAKIQKDWLPNSSHYISFLCFITILIHFSSSNKMNIYYLTVFVGQESSHRLIGHLLGTLQGFFQAFTGLCSYGRLIWGRLCSLSSLPMVSWRFYAIPRGHLQFLAI